MVTKIKSLNLFNLDETFAVRVKDLVIFVSENSISNTRDITNILTYYVFCDILEVYKNQSGMILFYMSTKCYNWLLSDGGIIRELNFKKVLDLFTKKIKFPIVITSMSYTDFKSLLLSNSPEYDEIINGYNFISGFWEEIIKVIKNLKFYTLEEKILKKKLRTFDIIETFNKNHG